MPSEAEEISGGLDPRPLHPLLEYRLELLERMLSGVLPRVQRQSVVQAAEREMRERLARLPPGEPTDAQVLDILRQCDPPEAGLASLLTDRQAIATGPGSTGWVLMLEALTVRRARPRLRSALWAAVIGGCSLLLILVSPFVYLAVMTLGELFGELGLYVSIASFLILMFITGLAAVGAGLGALWQLRRRRGTHTGYAYATAGLVAGCLPLAFSGLLGVYLLSEWISLNTAATAAPPPPAAATPPANATLSNAQDPFLQEQALSVTATVPASNPPEPEVVPASAEVANPTEAAERPESAEPHAASPNSEEESETDRPPEVPSARLDEEV